ncbi:MAG: M15 family metallopeptidase [Verrucomicrobiota bacterium]|nr:M15 family metallopeptidase [Verrucomicrobiota bacterium]
MRLISLEKIPGLVIDLVYATPHNFTGKTVYPASAKAYLQKGSAKRLQRVQAALQKRGIGLKILDAYRPLSAQKKFWELVPDPRFVADPAQGSRHNRGAAVDLTLVDREGRELPMPSAFDEFTERAHRQFAGGSPEELANRTQLEEAMAREGFLLYPDEWWHFDDPEWERYPVLDLSFEELQ